MFNEFCLVNLLLCIVILFIVLGFDLMNVENLEVYNLYKMK